MAFTNNYTSYSHSVHQNERVRQPQSSKYRVSAFCGSTPPCSFPWSSAGCGWAFICPTAERISSLSCYLSTARTVAIKHFLRTADNVAEIKSEFQHYQIRSYRSMHVYALLGCSSCVMRSVAVNLHKLHTLLFNISICSSGWGLEPKGLTPETGLTTEPLLCFARHSDSLVALILECDFWLRQQRDLLLLKMCLVSTLSLCDKEIQLKCSSFQLSPGNSSTWPTLVQLRRNDWLDMTTNEWIF